MDDLIISAKRRVFIFDRMQTMRACRDNSFWIHLIQDFHIRRSQSKENILASGAAGGVAGALFILSEYGKINSCRVQDFCKGLGGLLCARVSSWRAANPPQNVGFGILLNGWDVESLRPFHAIGLRHIPRISIVFHAFE